MATLNHRCVPLSTAVPNVDLCHGCGRYWRQSDRQECDSLGQPLTLSTICRHANQAVTSDPDVYKCRDCPCYVTSAGTVCEAPKIAINCSSCFRPTALSEAEIEEIKGKKSVTLPYLCIVPVEGERGVLERVREARRS